MPNSDNQVANSPLANKIFDFIRTHANKEASLNQVMIAINPNRRKIGFILNTDDRFVQRWGSSGVTWSVKEGV